MSSLVALQHQAHGFSLLPRKPMRLKLGGRGAPLAGRLLNVQLRNYQARPFPKAATGTPRLNTRVSADETERCTLLLVDQRFTMFFGSVRKSVTAAEVAALAAWRALAQKDRVGALIFNDSKVTEIRPQRNDSAVLRVLREIVHQNHALSLASAMRANPAMFNEALRRCDRIARRNCFVCVISNGNGSDGESRRLLARIARRNELLFLFVHDPLELDLPESGTLAFNETEQPEVSINIHASHGGRRKAPNETRTGNKFFRHREAPVFSLNTNEEVVRQIRKQLGGR